MEKLKLMLVDDEERFLETTKKLLTKAGYEALTASSGEESLELLGMHTVHVVVLDVKMPGMDGLETLKKIKTLYPLTEVIMLTGHATVEDAVDGMKSGASDYVMKPCDINDLLGRVEQAFKRRMGIEERISMAQARSYVKSPREILRQKAE
ncbi:Response regulator receiver domain-containing protein [Desulfatibacillum alkenivorans DSM 16219]|uniref:Response regulator receiver domain-containing protein n=1 Tax=Desulfatibacillum alkenivorans DSM 16219 TaxID=1121393 RepID=A0A1M6XK66_9BACT|nr:response regulator [Desulfatibacillum alkenivorans]SHL06390.1 Response regulator receiver domain-containing protein [Desulfatibacillum alkenivorans DSM 16219]